MDRGFHSGKISSILGIGAGTVSGIIKNARFTMNDIDLRRAVGKSLYHEQVDLYTFSESINLKRKMNELELPQEYIENFIEELMTLSFKIGIEPNILLEKLIAILIVCSNHNVAIEEKVYFIGTVEDKLKEIEDKVKDKEEVLNRVTKDICLEIEDYEDYKASKTWKQERTDLIHRLQKREEEIAILQIQAASMVPNKKDNHDSPLY
ncbi:MAG: hypothetical protein M3Y25_06865 [Thermoproteota archaeon]|nr:hypothetical protein [Thermoproteota archaeon]